MRHHVHAFLLEEEERDCWPTWSKRCSTGKTSFYGASAAVTSCNKRIEFRVGKGTTPTLEVPDVRVHSGPRFVELLTQVSHDGTLALEVRPQASPACPSLRRSVAAAL